jgi:hypothetical protein
MVETENNTLPAPVRASWRDYVKVHPAAEALPLMPAGELRELANDIQENGLRTTIAVTRDGVLVDGRNRLDALELLGWTLVDPATGTWTREFRPWVAYAAEEQPEERTVHEVISHNIRRRHLSEKDRVGLALKVLETVASATNGAVPPIGNGLPIGRTASLAEAHPTKKPIAGDHGQLRGSTKSVVGQVAELASVSRPTARRHLAANGVVKAKVTKPSLPAKASPATTIPAPAGSSSRSETAPATVPKRTGLETAVLALQRFSDRKALRKELRQVLRRAQALAQRHPTRRGQLGDLYLQIGVAFADDSITRPAKTGGAR